MSERPYNDRTESTKFELAAAEIVLLALVICGWNALWWVGGAALALLWRAATSRAIGQRIGEAWPLSGRCSFVMFALAAVAGMALFGGAWPTLLLSAGFLFVAAAHAGLFRSEDQGGPLVLDLDAGAPEGPFRALGFAGLLGGGMPLALLLLYSDHSQIRRDGLITGSRLMPWSRIASWAWEFSEDSSVSLRRPPDVLVLRLYRRFPFMPPVRIRIPEGRQAEVEAILAAQIGPRALHDGGEAGY